MLCNRFKGADVGSIDLQTGELIRLFNPRQDQWRNHFHLAEGTIEPLSTVGVVTVKLLRLNATERLVERLLLQELGSYPR